ncbi:Aspartyl-tRNA(Asn)/glutamyl-tRNA(Gln) amidotransferase subunit A [Chelatococcus asaccharovorans]|nr:Aspartyl-tRNA(Asn)/glutamyl-tRNA(Gln) amidotransferase subunit A [Chelatococcus asaccharovorans]CAH1684249.1 Aspartyl-tRNA(Asn)/glutamyl-tRNA(Gln) amidotransferase subunit A [Chelatococcus asaccharovorans]
MTGKGYPHRGIVETREAIEAGALTAVAAVEERLEAIAAHDGRLNAFVLVDAHGARSAAGRLDAQVGARGPLHGVPIAIKDVIDVAGLPTLAGSRSRDGHVAERDAPIVAQLRAAGAIVLGKLRTYELGFGTVEPGTGLVIAANPWDETRWTGASSSGAASAVAAGFCAAAVASDTAGSTRTPAALCGLVGFKPGRGSVDLSGFVPLAPSLDMAGLMARSVPDMTCLAEALGFGALKQDGAPRIGLVVNWDLEVGFEPAALPLWIETKTRLAEAGAFMSSVSLPSLRSYHDTCFAALIDEANDLYGASIAAADQAFGSSLRARLAARTALDAARARADRPALEAALGRVLQTVDVLLIPATGGIAPKVSSLTTLGFLSNPQLTTPFSLVGVPALSLPAGLVGGLPFGIQLASRDPNILLRVAAWVEQVLGVGPFYPTDVDAQHKE